MERIPGKAPTFAEFDSDLTAAMERIQLARPRGDSSAPVAGY